MKRFASALTASSSHFHLLRHSPMAGCGHVPGIVLVSKRHLNLHEYQSKALMQDHKINIQKFRVANSVQEAEQIAKEFKVREYVIKAQILAGGRGKGTFSNGFKGGVQLTQDPAQVAPLVSKMLNSRLVTKQTPPEGVLVQRVMVAEALDLVRETYLAILMDRDSGGPVVVASSQGGVDIEEVAETNPEAIVRLPLDINKGLGLEQARMLAEKLQFSVNLREEVAQQLIRLYDMFLRRDCVQLEINPFGETPDGRVVCFDAKLNFDDSAAYRQKDIFSQEDLSESDPAEVAAQRVGVNYVSMGAASGGNIGCMVNGAGLAMATMDIVQLHGGKPANFLDVGGMVNQKSVEAVFRIIGSDAQVKSIFVNIFAGIVDCATVAKGILGAFDTAFPDPNNPLPLVVRLLGNNAAAASDMLRESGRPIHAVEGFDEAAALAVKFARGG